MGLTLISALVCAPMGVALGQDQASGSREEAAIFDDVEGEEVDQDVDSDIRQEGGEKVKVFRFSGLDLAGRLVRPPLPRPGGRKAEASASTLSCLEGWQRARSRSSRSPPIPALSSTLVSRDE